MTVLKRNFILFVFLIILFDSCSSDSGVSKNEYTFNGACKSTIALNGFANQQTTSVETVTPLDTLLKDYDYVLPITKGTMFLTNTTSIEINGLKKDVVLENFTLKINDNEYKFGNITYQDTILYTDQTMNYFKGVFDKMIQQQRLTTSASFTPNETIDEKTGVKVNIVFGGVFYYWK